MDDEWLITIDVVIGYIDVVNIAIKMTHIIYVR